MVNLDQVLETPEDVKHVEMIKIWNFRKWKYGCGGGDDNGVIDAAGIVRWALDGGQLN